MSDFLEYYMDLHIHIGRTKSYKPVKITASNQLTLGNILHEALHTKGLDIIGIIDAHSPEVIEEVQELMDTGYCTELPGGGVRYLEKVTLLLGAEIEINDEYSKGPIHVLCFMPTVETMNVFSKWCGTKMKNSQLSSQRIYVSGKELQSYVKSLEGWFIPAHVFTPFKSLFGKGVEYSLQEVFIPEMIDAIELGLSSDTFMADQLIELKNFPFLTNSDAHSLSKIAREHQILSLKEPSFLEIEKAFNNRFGREIKCNVGLHPRLGKYYHSVCAKCSTLTVDEMCPNCQDGKVIRGVAERIKELAEVKQKNAMNGKLVYEERIVHRPKYLHQVPLEFIPGCGPKTVRKLLDAFQNEMNVIHRVPEIELIKIVSKDVANRIVQARSGKLSIKVGGGGVYGKLQ